MKAHKNNADKDKQHANKWTKQVKLLFFKENLLILVTRKINESWISDFLLSSFNTFLTLVIIVSKENHSA